MRQITRLTTGGYMKKYIKRFVFYFMLHVAEKAIANIDWIALIDRFTHLFYLDEEEKCYAKVGKRYAMV